MEEPSNKKDSLGHPTMKSYRKSKETIGKSGNCKKTLQGGAEGSTAQKFSSPRASQQR